MSILSKSLQRLSHFSKFQVSLDFDHIIRGRRSVRDFSEKEVPDYLIEEIIDSGTWAPSAHNFQPWSFHVVRDQDVLHEISDVISETLVFNFYGSYFHGGIGIFLAAKDFFELGGKNFNQIECGMVLQNMELTAYDRGLDTCTVGLSIFAKEFIEDILDFEKDEEFVCALSIGYKDEDVSVEAPVRKIARIKYY